MNDIPASMYEDIRRLKADVAEIKAAIIGNPGIGHRGIVPRLDSVETAVAQIASERAAEANAKRGAIWVLSVAAATAGAIGGLITRIFTQPS